MPQHFYLSSHDFGLDSRPRKCGVASEVLGDRDNSRYFLVNIVPPVITRFRDGPSTEFDHIILAIAGDRTMQDFGAKPVMADIVICPTYSGGVLDERKCSRIGVGRIHATYAEALKNSPVEVG